MSLNRVIAAMLSVSFGLSLAAPRVADAQISSAVFTTVSNSSVLITTAKCSGSRPIRSGSGFVWHSKSEVVTALHVVIGCQSITVTSPMRANDIANVRISHVDPDHDLAMLKSPLDVGAPPLTVAATPYLSGSLAAIGFPYGVTSASSTDLSERYVQGGSLSNILDSNDAARIASAHWPSLSEPVLNLEGHLVPGLSGAPVVNDQGSIVGVADGGLKDGYVAISWAIKASAIAALLSKPQSSSATGNNVADLFAYDGIEPAQMISVSCSKDFIVDRIGAESYLGLAPNSDDANGLSSFTQALMPNVTSEVFDIYQDRSSGIAFVLPTGLRLKRSSEGCTAVSNNGAISYFIRVSRFDNLSQLLKGALSDETALFNPVDGWQADPSYSYPKPLSRPDRMFWTRKTYVKGVIGAWSGAAFATYATRDRVELTVAVKDLSINPSLQSQSLSCIMNNITSSACSTALVAWYAWGEAVHAVWFATFSQYV